ncbi:LysE/ArgO family amino acid transporter [Pediococcus claussenii]|uniref:L-lysine permease, lysE type n=1 Tax=Pediococcus claussenii (strain ATCC BAA-344 / DSM 14800 / JCM 18046 / KCTC 3811 / LMG 21948 / P06) TaxID=701521 RepID=G8PDW7_PEDCP|nr:LysE family transporter [Pediococcus claussenii]AEV95452.1 L-lysine permease, lysE type [Pediococcus claussenii ATCC BAA-344]ANZ68978.1 L-lysine permease [Pediococcus claussenii]ANZ70794.1 L-lysine permease [Pediococcus claussenii]
MSILIQGIIFGIAYIAPIGMQNIYVIDSSLEYPLRRAISIALIVAAFDMSLALASFYGMGTLLQRYLWLKQTILLVGSLMVFYIGVSLFRENKKTVEVDDKNNNSFSYRSVILSAFTIAWLNPQAIIDGTMLLGAFRASFHGTDNPNWFIVGVCISSISWFIVLTSVINYLREQFNSKYLLILNKVCGVIIILYGVKLVADFIHSI